METLFEEIVTQLVSSWDLNQEQKEQLQAFADCFDPNMSDTDVHHYLESAISSFLIT